MKAKLKRALKIVGIVLASLLGLAAVFVAWNWPALSVFPALPSGYEAKELCSCLFVEGRTQPECEAFIRQSVVPIDGRSFDMEGKSVTVTALWTTRSARFVSPRFGCVIDGGKK
jgi:hypothetical protein